MSSNVTFKLIYSITLFVGHCRAVACVHLALLVLVFFVSGCTSYPGDNILRLTESKVALDDSRAISVAQSAIVELLDHLDIPEKRRAAFEKISLKKVVRVNQYTKLSNIENTLVVARGDVDIAHAINSVIVTKRVVHISSGYNNVVVSADNIDVGRDGSERNGSMLIAKGTTKVAFAYYSIVSSIKGVNITHAKGLVLNNFPEKPLFAEEKQPKESKPVLTKKTDIQNKLAQEMSEEKLGTAKWSDAEVHMVCLYRSNNRKVIVEVQMVQKPIILVVCAYEGIVWDIRAGEGVEIVQVIASGAEPQQVEGTTAPVATYSYDENSQIYFYTHSTTVPGSDITGKVRQLTGKEISSYQGRQHYENTPFVVGAKGLIGNVCQATVFEIAGLSIYWDCYDVKLRQPNHPITDSKMQAKNKEIEEYISQVNRHPFNPGTRLTVAFGKQNLPERRYREKYPPCSLLLDTFVSRYGDPKHLARDTEGGNNDWYYTWNRDIGSLRLACIGLESERYARYASIVLTPNKKGVNRNQ